MPTYKNRYHYEACDETWEDDQCDSAHNDRCPKCNAEIEPTDSEMVEELTEVRVTYHKSPAMNLERWYGVLTTDSDGHQSQQSFFGLTEPDLLGQVLLHLQTYGVLDYPVQIVLKKTEDPCPPTT